MQTTPAEMQTMFIAVKHRFKIKGHKDMNMEYDIRLT